MPECLMPESQEARSATCICSPNKTYVDGNCPVHSRQSKRSAAYTTGDRVRFWEEESTGDELTFEGVVVSVVVSNGDVRLLIDTPLGRFLRTQDEVEPARRGRRA